MSRQIIQVLLEINPQFSQPGTIHIYPVGTNFGTRVVDMTLYLVDEFTKQKIKLDVSPIQTLNWRPYIEVISSDLEYFHIEGSKLYLTGELSSNTINNSDIYKDKLFKSDYFPEPTSGKTTIRTDTFKKFHKKLPIGNLLYKRIRMGFPKWSGVEKNDLSGALKLLEPLFSPLYAQFNKNITLSNSQRLGTKLQEDLEIQGQRDDASFVFMLKDQTVLPLFEGDSSIHPKYYELVENTQRSIVLSSVLLERTSLTSDFNLEPFYNTTLYIRSTLQDDFGFVTIKGYAINNEPLQERVKVISHNYIQCTRKFSKITEISSTISAQLSNYVDCRSSHYISKNTVTYPPIVDSNLEFFDPIFKLAYNTKNTLDVYSGNPTISSPVEQFSLESDHTVNSIYLDEHLRAYWTDGNSLRSGILSKDLTKVTGMHPSTNCNDVISVSNTNTIIGESVNISINTSAWNLGTGMIIQVKNKDNIVYYDHSTKSFTNSMSTYYPSDTDKFIEFELEVDNASPYIFTVRDPLFKSTNVAMTVAEELLSILTTDTTSTLVVYNGRLMLNDTPNDYLSTLVIKDDYKSDHIKLEVSTLDLGEIKNWNLSWKGRNVNSEGNSFVNITRLHTSPTHVSLIINRAELLKDTTDENITLDLSITSDVEVVVNVLSNGVEGFVRGINEDKDCRITFNKQEVSVSANNV